MGPLGTVGNVAIKAYLVNFFFFFSCVGTLAPPAPWTLPYLSKKNRILLRILLVIEFYFLFTCGCMLSITVLELWCIFRGRYFHLYIIPSITVTELWCFFSERGISIICKFFIPIKQPPLLALCKTIYPHLQMLRYPLCPPQISTEQYRT